MDLQQIYPGRQRAWILHEEDPEEEGQGWCSLNFVTWTTSFIAECLFCSLYFVSPLDIELKSRCFILPESLLLVKFDLIGILLVFLLWYERVITITVVINTSTTFKWMSQIVFSGSFSSEVGLEWTEDGCYFVTEILIKHHDSRSSWDFTCCQY